MENKNTKQNDKTEKNVEDVAKKYGEMGGSGCRTSNLYAHAKLRKTQEKERNL